MRYFAGKTLAGDVVATKATTFKQLVDTYLAVPIPLPLTRAQFDALSPREQDKTKTVPYLVPAVFATSPSRRKKNNALHCNLVFLDIDPPKDGKQAPAKVLLKNLDTLELPWSYAIYHTARSTPAAPRLRVVVDADQIPLEEYDAAVRTVAKRIGLPVVTTESMVPVQAMFRPVVFEGQPEDHQPLLECRTDGRPFTVGDIDPDVSGVYTERRGKEHITASGNGLDALDFLRSPVDDVSITDASEMLDALDPDMEYREWLEVAASLKHQFHIEEEQAYQLFDAWSSKGNKYQGEEETRAKWDSFVVNPIGRVPVTIRSLMHRAALAGWQGGKVKERQFSTLQKWFETAGASLLLTEGASRIAATPMLSQTEEEALLNMLSAAMKKAKLSVSTAALRRDMRVARERLRGKQDAKQASPPWVRGVVFVAATEQFYRHSNQEAYTTKAWDQVHAKKLLPNEKQLEEAGIPVTQANLSKPLLQPSAFALNVIKIPTVWDYTYDPSTTDTLVIKDSRAFVNTYRKCSPQPVWGEADEAGELFMGHIRALIAEPEYQRILVDWLAFHVQSPGTKIRWAPLIQGAEGCGKTFLADVMAVVLGRAHVKPIGGRDLFSGWTDWATGHQLVVLEEVRVSGVNRHEVMNVFKPLITNDVIPVAERFRNSRHVDNKTNYLLLTNHKDSLVLDHTSRRYFVLQSRIQTKEQVLALKSRQHFHALYEMLNSRPGGLRAWFEAYPISESFDPNSGAPETVYLESLINDSANETTAAVRRIIAEGDAPLVQFDLVSTKVLLDLLHDREGLRKVSAQHLSAILRDEGYKQQGRHMIGDVRHYLWSHQKAGDDNWGEVARRREEMQTTHLGMEDLL